MIALLRRAFWVAALGAGGVAGWSVWSSRKSSASAVRAADPPSWPPIEPTMPATSVADGAGDAAGAANSLLGDIPVADAPVADVPVAAEPVAEPPVADVPVAALGTWVGSDGGTCPLSHPIKANSNSRIFHVPGGRFYEQTRAERCYAVAEDAEADGYRRAKS